MFDAGLNPRLPQCLSELVQHVPSYLATIQERLLDLLSMVLSNNPYYHPGTPASFRVKKRTLAMSTNPLGVDGASRSAQILLALETLGSFDFRPHYLIDFVKESVVKYLEDDMVYVYQPINVASTHKRVSVIIITIMY
jgi:serine/threonine-protein kinase mTOR